MIFCVYHVMSSGGSWRFCIDCIFEVVGSWAFPYLSVHEGLSNKRMRSETKKKIDLMKENERLVVVHYFTSTCAKKQV
jgi:hypothetical protein